MPCSKQTPTDLTILTDFNPGINPYTDEEQKTTKMLEEKIQLGYYRIRNLQVS